MSVFFWLETALTPPGARSVSRMTARGVMEEFKNGEDLRSCPFLSPSEALRTVTRPTSGRRGFRPVPFHASEGGCLDFVCLYVDATTRASRLASTTCSETCCSNESDLPCSRVEMEKKEPRHTPCLRVTTVSNEIAGRPNEVRTTVRGVAERLGNREHLVYGTPGPPPEHRAVSNPLRSVHLCLSRLPLDAPAKTIKPVSVTCS